MKKLILTLALVAASGLAFAQINVQRNELGTGTPGAAPGFEQAEQWAPGTGIYNVEKYLPGYPTSATIWPRVVEVNCEQGANGPVNCAGFNWLPEMGRAEYLLVKPRIVKPVAPQIEYRDRTIIREVPAKPNGG